MSAFLFIVIIDWLMRDVTDQKRTGIRSSLFTMLEDLDFADDIAMPSHTWEHLQQKTTRMSDLDNTVGLRINTEKTKVMSNDPNRAPILINNQVLEYVDRVFTYLGSVVDPQGGTEEDIKLRLGRARAAFTRMKSVWKSNTYSRKTKLRLYKSYVLPVLLYGSECWRMTKRDQSRLSAHHLPQANHESILAKQNI